MHIYRVESFLSFLIRPDDPVLTGRPGPGLISLGISSISDSEDDSDGDVSTNADRGVKGKIIVVMPFLGRLYVLTYEYRE
jgi:hypothetical protein